MRTRWATAESMKNAGSKKTAAARGVGGPILYVNFSPAAGTGTFRGRLDGCVTTGRVT